MIPHVSRHGATDSNLAGPFNDSDDESLAACNAADIADIAFDTEPYDVVHVSPARRRQETARGLGLRGWWEEPRLIERDLGVFKGRTPDQWRVEHSDAFAAFSAFDPDFVTPSAWSGAHHLARVMAWLDELQRSGVRQVLAVSHGGVVDFLFRIGTGEALHGGARIFAGENLGLSSFEASAEGLRVTTFTARLSRGRA